MTQIYANNIQKKTASMYSLSGSKGNKKTTPFFFVPFFIVKATH